MPAYKDNERGTWMASFYYEDWNGNRNRKVKRGFRTKREALEYEKTFSNKSNHSIDMTFKEFFTVYKKDIMPRIKLNTWLTKESIIIHHIMPYLAKFKLTEIKPKHIVSWQNHLTTLEDDKGNNYAPTYLRTINTQLSSMFNHAVKLYGLKSNPIHVVGSMGRKHSDNADIWTKEEFESFIETQKENSMAEVGFLILFWCGLRIGELLALTYEDFNFKLNYIRINKSYQRLKRKDVITKPKTEKSNRIIYTPGSIMDVIELYAKSLYGLGEKDRVFPVTKSFFQHRLKTGSKKLGLKKIRLHDLRHSQVSLLFEMGYSPIDIANRMGHENINVTMRYAHMMPSKQIDMADEMNKLIREDGKDDI